MTINHEPKLERLVLDNKYSLNLHDFIKYIDINNY